MALSPEIIAAVQRWGPSVDGIAKQHGISGTALLAKLIQGESGGISNRTSSAGAKGLTQFMPGSRQISIQKYGVDPWADVDQAVHAASLHLRGKINGSTGLQGYNPGMPTYTSYILGQKVGNVAGGARPSPVRNTGPAATPTGSAPAAATPGLPQITGGGQAGDFTSLLSSLLTRPEQQQAAPMPIAPPSFAATPRLPQGFTPTTNIAPVQAPQQDRVSQALSLVEALGATGPTVGSPGAPEGAEGTTAAPGIAETVVADRSRPRAATGKVIVAPGANREGVGLSKPILSFVERVAGVYGKPLTVGTGTSHNQFVAGTNRESAHWRGNAVDIPSSGKTLIRQGQAALIAAGMPASQARKQTGGLFNVGRYQVIFATNEGGNHYDHLHVGLRG